MTCWAVVVEFDLSTYDLSQAHDVRPLVVSTLLTYLELEGIIEATGPFHAEYKFKSDRSWEAILEGFDPSRRDFLAGIFGQATRTAGSGRRSTSRPRAGRWASPGDGSWRPWDTSKNKGVLTIQVLGARLGYRRLKDDVDRAGLLETLNEPVRRSGGPGRVQGPLDARVRDRPRLPVGSPHGLFRRGAARPLRALRPLPGRGFSSHGSNPPGWPSGRRIGRSSRD